MVEHPSRDRSERSAHSPLSLRHKLLLFAAALVLLPGVLLAAIAVRSGSASLERVIGRQLAREAGHAAERIASTIRDEQRTLANFAHQDLMREIRVADVDKRISMALATLRDGSAARRQYLVATASGDVVAASDPGLIGPTPSWIDRAWLAADGEGRLWGPVAAPQGGELLVMSTPIPDPDDPGRLLGTLLGLFDWKRLTAATERVRSELAAQGIEADVLVCRGDGAVVGGALSAAAPDRARLDGVADAVRGFSGTTPDYAVDAGAGLIVGRAAFAPDLPPWRLLVIEPRAHALAPARRLSSRLVLTMGLALAAALGVATLAARRVVRPLSELTRAIDGLARADPSARRVPVRTADEVGTLARTFNRMASELDQTQRELVEAEKFAFVGELAAGVAHEIRTSLGVLGSSAQILERSLPKERDPQVGELAQMMRAEVGRLEGVVSDLLTLRRDRPLRLEPLRVSAPVFRAVDFVTPQAHERGVHIERSTAVDEPSVSCDAELVYQVAVNLLVNAVQALAEGGRIEVRILGEKDGTGGFEVRDDGGGIPEELRERIFQPFVTARRGGIGLGLTFVQRVVHDHRGRVSVGSRPGSGTCFRIELPLAEADT